MTIRNYLANKFIELKKQYPNSEEIQQLDIVYMENNLTPSEAINLEKYEVENDVVLNWNSNVNNEIQSEIDEVISDFITHCV